MNRRDALIAGTLVASGGLAFWAKPSGDLDHSARVDLDQILTRPIPGAPQTEAKDVILASAEELGGKYFDQLAVARYAHRATGDVTVLLAHGLAQSQTNQLHRPESCYPASGFEILSQQSIAFAYANWRIPAQVVTAKRGRRIDTVIYWARVGSEFPAGLWEQRFVAARGAIAGASVDGLLARFSLSSFSEAAPADALLAFIAQFCAAQGPDAQRLLLGSSGRG